jgi:ArsR family transcriptional regulator
MLVAKDSVCVCEITEVLNLSQPKISRHLALLRNLSIVLDQRKGQWVYYRLNPELPDWANQILNIITMANHNLIEKHSGLMNISHCCE